MKAVSWAIECRTESAKKRCEQSHGEKFQRRKKHLLLDRHCFQILLAPGISTRRRYLGTLRRVQVPRARGGSLGSHRVQGLQENLAANAWLCSDNLSCLNLCRAP